MNIFYKTRWIFLIAILIRFFGVFTCGNPLESFKRISNGKIKEQAYAILSVNNDEILVAEIALCHHYGLSYASRHEGKRARYVYDFTGYRSSYHIYMHIFFQEVYFKLFPLTVISLVRTDPYFVAVAFILQFISTGLFFISLCFFRRLADYFFDGFLSNISLLLYSIYPPVLLYVGNLINFESITTSLLIVNMALLMKACFKKLSTLESCLVVFNFIISILFRPQQNFIYIFLFSIYFLISILKRNQLKYIYKQSVILIVACFLMFVVTHIPVLIKNYRLFNVWTLGTNGTTFIYGHNPFARGSWCGTCDADSTSAYYKYIRENISDYDLRNEYYKSKACMELALRWIKGNIREEILLDVRKMAIYFLPYNNDHNVFNPFNLFFHIGTILFISFTFYKTVIKREFSGQYWLLSAPLAGSIAVTLVFFVGYRWRYYAEPFMILMTLIVMKEFYNTYRKGRIKKMEEK